MLQLVWIILDQYNADKQNLEKTIGEVESKIPDTSGLVTITFLNTKIGEVENKILDDSGLVKKTDFIAKISIIKEKYFTTLNKNKFTSEIVDAKIKQANLVPNSDLSTLWQCAFKNVEKMEKLKTVNLSFFLVKFFLVVMVYGFQNMFVYQPKLNTLELK